MEDFIQRVVTIKAEDTWLLLGSNVGLLHLLSEEEDLFPSFGVIDLLDLLERFVIVILVRTSVSSGVFGQCIRHGSTDHGSGRAAGPGVAHVLWLPKVASWHPLLSRSEAVAGELLVTSLGRLGRAFPVSLREFKGKHLTWFLGVMLLLLLGWRMLLLVKLGWILWL